MTIAAEQFVERASRRMNARASAILKGLESSLTRVAMLWLLLAMSACSIRIVSSPAMGQQHTLDSFFPYILVTLGPVATLLFALRWFADGERMERTDPWFRRDKSRRVAPEEARAHRLYGTGGIMVSLLVGMLLNVPVRTAEYLVSIPAIPPVAPEWLATLHFMMTLDVVLLTCLYTLAFVAAFRKVPWFPLLLCAVWLTDIAMQLLIAQAVTATPLPGAVIEPLETLLAGNAKKVLISVAIWAPYLLMSKRVDVTYRHRVPSA